MQKHIIKKLISGAALAAIAMLGMQSGRVTIWASELGADSQPASFGGGYVLSEDDNNTPTVELPEYQTYAGREAIPAAYPSKVDQSFIDSMPANRDQNPYGTCWAFSSVGLAEFDLIHDGAADKTIDLSELSLAYFNYHTVVDPLGGTEGDYIRWNDGPNGRYTNTKGQFCYLQYGGSYQMSVRRFAQWCGPTTEAVLPYSQAVTSVTNGLSSEYAYGKNAAYMIDAYFTNIRTNPELVKEQIMKHGGVGITYYESTYYHKPTSEDASCVLDSYYVPVTENLAYGGYHAVMIVGWDDNYSRENFGYSEAERPASDGAWLVRNSWGENTPYFWISYCDPKISDSAVSFDFTANRPYDNNYQLDGGMDTCKVEATTVANVFQIKAKDGVDSETLKAVSLSMVRAANVSYQIDVYKNLKYSWKPQSGDKVSTTTGSTLNAGVYTIPLEQEVELSAGDTFSVVVTTNKSAIDCEQASSAQEEATKNYIYNAAVQGYQTGTDYNSYIDSGSGLQRNIYANVCIKAFTDNNVKTPAVEPVIPTHTVTLNANGGKLAAGSSFTVSEGGKYDGLDAYVPTRDGYSFEGWYTAADGGSKISSASTVAVTSDQTLYAHWKQNEDNTTGNKPENKPDNTTGSTDGNKPGNNTGNTDVNKPETKPDNNTSGNTTGNNTNNNTNNNTAPQQPAQEINGWSYENGCWYYYENNNRVTGWKSVNGVWYYMNSDASMATGWVWDGANWYYMSSSGAMTTGWVWDGYNWYYMSSSGAMVTGWAWDGANWYYMDASGAMMTGWVWDGSNWYYMSGSGAMATGWVWDGSNWYYMSGSGAMATGWVWDGSNWYYMNGSGAMMTGKVRIGKKVYRFNASGAWVR